MRLFWGIAAAAVYSTISIAGASSFNDYQLRDGWFENDVKAVEEPLKIPVDEQRDCALKILEHVNRQFHSDFEPEDVTPVELPGWERSEIGFVRGGAFNIRIVAPETEAHPRGIRPGRFLGLAGWIELGARPTLHLPGSIHGYSTFNVRAMPENPGVREFDFIAHLDTALPYEPLGALIHLFRDVIWAGGRNPCPGATELSEDHDN